MLGEGLGGLGGEGIEDAWGQGDDVGTGWGRMSSAGTGNSNHHG